MTSDCNGKRIKDVKRNAEIPADIQSGNSQNWRILLDFGYCGLQLEIRTVIPKGNQVMDTCLNNLTPRPL